MVGKSVKQREVIKNVNKEKKKKKKKKKRKKNTKNLDLV